MTKKSDEKISASIDVIIAFKKGALNRSEAIARSSFLTGLDPMFAEQFLCGLTRKISLSWPMGAQTLSVK